MEQNKLIYFCLFAFTITLTEAVPGAKCPQIWTGTQSHCAEAESGGKCTLRCFKGFHLVDENGQPMTERAVIFCTDGKWDEVTVTCVVDNCTDLQDYLNPGKTWDEFCAEKPDQHCKENKRHGPACVCDFGFQAEKEGSNCKVVQFCPGLESPVNGESDCRESKVPVKGRCNFVCGAYHKINGSSYLTCDAKPSWIEDEPSWSGEVPTCVDRMCKKRISENSGQTWEEFCRKQNKQCEEEGLSAFCGPCLDGFQEDPRDNGTCIEPISSACPDLVSPSGGMMTGDCVKARPGSKCLFACESGRKLLGEGILVCLEKGTWNYKTPTCTGFSSWGCDSMKDGTGETWRQVCERENRPCVLDPTEGPKCGCEKGLTEICLCTKKRQLLQGLFSYILQGRNNRYLQQINGEN